MSKMTHAGAAPTEERRHVVGPAGRLAGQALSGG